ncbi:flagella synthesis protein FlgN [Halomonas sp. LBP4]|uniref:flagella synthesis protein FlgN n=1 Tax=Halomonas sp. LBP4 TaxID=2044917 RepID=UPI000D7647B5|nr:flagellar protein FlgN [Halomonas sp. LBP4]PXX96474.1 flagellar biosynthesis protein FlgN [Halomonas sp. LBP4]
MSLARLLNDQQGRLAALVTLLEEELEALTAGQIDGSRLERIATEKQALLAELEGMEQLRRQVQRRLGYRDGHEGARAAARDADCLAGWEATLGATERADRLNRLAGQLLGMRLAHNQRMLDFIHEVSEKTLYDPRGRTGRQPGRLNASA